MSRFFQGVLHPHTVSYVNIHVVRLSRCIIDTTRLLTGGSGSRCRSCHVRYSTARLYCSSLLSSDYIFRSRDTLIVPHLLNSHTQVTRLSYCRQSFRCVATDHCHKWIANAILLFPRLSLFLSHCFARFEHQHIHLTSLHLRYQLHK